MKIQKKNQELRFLPMIQTMHTDSYGVLKQFCSCSSSDYVSYIWVAYFIVLEAKQILLDEKLVKESLPISFLFMVYATIKSIIINMFFKKKFQISKLRTYLGIYLSNYSIFLQYWKRNIFLAEQRVNKCTTWHRTQLTSFLIGFR